MRDEQFDYFNWRIDQLHKMVVALAHRVGHHDFAEDITRFHNNEVVAEANKIISDEDGRTP